MKRTTKKLEIETRRHPSSEVSEASLYLEEAPADIYKAVAFQVHMHAVDAYVEYSIRRVLSCVIVFKIYQNHLYL